MKYNLIKRELAEWIKAISLKLIWLFNNHIRSNRIFSVIKKKYNNNLNGLEPGWLGASFGLRICYVRIIITRNVIFLILL
jgi:hypothetical protein